MSNYVSNIMRFNKSISSIQDKKIKYTDLNILSAKIGLLVIVNGVDKYSKMLAGVNHKAITSQVDEEIASLSHEEVELVISEVKDRCKKEGILVPECFRNVNLKADLLLLPTPDVAIDCWDPVFWSTIEIGRKVLGTNYSLNSYLRLIGSSTDSLPYYGYKASVKDDIMSVMSDNYHLMYRTKWDPLSDESAFKLAKHIATLCEGVNTVDYCFNYDHSKHIEKKTFDLRNFN